jgi:hypothetical protein
VSARVDAQDAQAAAATANATPLRGGVPFAPPIEPIDPDERPGGGHALPSDHPAWMRDSLSLSGRARALLARIQPVVVRTIACWEHRVRSIAIGDRTLRVDTSGSYRFD